MKSNVLDALTVIALLVVLWLLVFYPERPRQIPSLDGHRFIIGGNGYELIHDPECPKCKEEQP